MDIKLERGIMWNVARSFYISLFVVFVLSISAFENDSKAGILPYPDAVRSFSWTDIPLNSYLSAQGQSYRIFRKGEEIGTYKVALNTTLEKTDIRAEVSVHLPVAFFPDIRFRMTVQSTLRNKYLERMTIHVDDNGDTHHILVRNGPKGVTVDGPDGTYHLKGTARITRHWLSAILDDGQFLDFMTGQFGKAQFKDLGRKKISAGGKLIEAHQLVISGVFDHETWLDDKGNFSGLRFEAPDGSIVDFIRVDQIASR